MDSANRPGEDNSGSEHLTDEQNLRTSSIHQQNYAAYLNEVHETTSAAADGRQGLLENDSSWRHYISLPTSDLLSPLQDHEVTPHGPKISEILPIAASIPAPPLLPDHVHSDSGFAASRPKGPAVSQITSSFERNNVLHGERLAQEQLKEQVDRQTTQLRYLQVKIKELEAERKDSYKGRTCNCLELEARLKEEDEVCKRKGLEYKLNVLEYEERIMDLGGRIKDTTARYEEQILQKEAECMKSKHRRDKDEERNLEEQARLNIEILGHGEGIVARDVLIAALEERIVFLTQAPASEKDLQSKLEEEITLTEEKGKDIQAFETVFSSLHDQLSGEQLRTQDLEAEISSLKAQHKIDINVAFTKGQAAQNREREAYISHLESLLETTQLTEKDLWNDIVLLKRELKEMAEKAEKWKRQGGVTLDLRNALAISTARILSLEKEIEGLKTRYSDELARVQGDERVVEASNTRHIRDLERQIADALEREKRREDPGVIKEALRREKLRADTLQRQVDILPQKYLEIAIMEKKLRALEREIVYGTEDKRTEVDKEDEVRWKMRRLFQAIEVEKAITPLPDPCKLPTPEPEEEEERKIMKLEKLQDETWNLRVMSRWMGWDGKEGKSKKQLARERLERKRNGAFTRGRTDVQKELLGVGEFPLLERMIEHGESVPSMLVTAPNGEISIDWGVLGWKPRGLDELIKDLEE